MGAVIFPSKMHCDTTDGGEDWDGRARDLFRGLCACTNAASSAWQVAWVTAARGLRNDPRLEAARDAAPEGVRAELIGGALLMSPAPRSAHQIAQGRLSAQLDRALRVRGVDSHTAQTGWVFVQVPELHLWEL